MPAHLTPDGTTIHGFLLGTSTPDEANRVAAWLAADPAAPDALRRVTAGDLLTAAVTTAGGPDNAPADDVERLVTTVLQSLGVTQTPADAPATGPLPTEVGGYAVICELGRGGMGVVLEAEDRLLGRRVAVKLIAPGAAANPDARERFLREARAAATVEHDNVVPVLHVGEDGGLPYIVMPLLRGETLDARLRRDGRLTSAEAVRVGREVAAGLAAAHATGLTHRDVKPANIWLDADTGRARLLDFGIAKPSAGTDPGAAHTRTGAILGTPHYMAPEQAEGLPLDGRADLFALGVVLYHATTGRRPFDGRSALAVLRAVSEHEPEAPAAVNPDVPLDLSMLILCLMKKNPSDRPPTAEDVRAALLAAVTVAPRVATQPAPKRGRIVGRWAVAAAALLLLLGSAAAAYQLVFKSKDGALVVEVDGDADVRFKNGELLIYDADGKLKYTLRPGERTAALPPGPYRVAVTGADGVKAETPEFTMTQGGKVVIRVTATGPPADPGVRPAPLPPGASLYDRLDPAAIPPTELFPDQPEGLVAVIGSRVQRSSFSNFSKTQTVAVRPDGGMIAYHDGSRVVLRNPKTGESRTCPREFSGRLLFSADGSRLLSLSDAGVVAVWDVRSEPPKKVAAFDELTAHNLNEMQWCRSADGKVIAAFGPYMRSVVICDWSDPDRPVFRSQIDGKKELGGIHAGVSADGKTVAVRQASGTVVDVYDITAKEPKLRCTLPDVVWLEAVHNQLRFDFHPDGRLGVTHTDRRFRMWDVSGDKPRVLSVTEVGQHDAPPSHFSPDGKFVIGLRESSTLALYRVPTEDDKPLERVGEYEAKRDRQNTWYGYFSGDGKMFVTTHLGRYFTVWDVSAKGLTPRLPPPGYTHFGLGADGKMIVAARDDDTLTRLELGGDRPKDVTESYQTSRRDGALALWNISGNALLAYVQQSGGWCRPLERDGKLHSFPLLAWWKHPLVGARGNFAVAVTKGAEATTEASVWDFATDPPKRVTANVPLKLMSSDTCFVTDDGRFVLTVHDDGLARLWRIADGTLKSVSEVKHGDVGIGVGGSADGKLVAFSDGRVFDVSDGTFKLVTHLPRSGRLVNPAFSPNGNWVAVGGETVAVYDLATREVKYSWDCRGNTVRQLRFAPDGRHLVTCNDNGTIFVIRLAPPPK